MVTVLTNALIYYLARMFRKVLSFTILFSMTLHCAGRLGVLSWLYENRNTAAYTLGIIAEIPIAVCSNQFDFHKGIHIENKTTDKALPLHVFQAQEINLFFISSIQLPVSFDAQAVNSFTRYELSDYTAPLSSVFHPPLRG